MARILVVDDEPDLRRYLSDELRDEGHQVDMAADGVEAMLRVIDGGVDAVLMDIRMPRLDGLNALRLMRRMQPGLPVIMFTGQAGQGDMLETTRLGALTCLLKPVNVDRLKEVVSQSIRRN